MRGKYTSLFYMLLIAYSAIGMDKMSDPIPNVLTDLDSKKQEIAGNQNCKARADAQKKLAYIKEKAMLIMEAFKDSNEIKLQRIRNSLIDSTYENKVINYLLVNYFVKHPEYIEKIDDFILFLYPDLSMQKIDNLSDEKLDQNLVILVDIFVKIKNYRERLAATKLPVFRPLYYLDKIILEIKMMIFQYLIQRVLKTSDSINDFKNNFLFIHENFGDEFFDQFIQFFKKQLASLEKKYPDKSFCIKRLRDEIDSVLKQMDIKIKI